jgi:DNA repair protein RadC
MPLSSINIYTLKQVRAKRRRYDLEGCRITCPLACYTTLQFILDLKAEPVEKFGIISLNTKNEINGIYIIGTGTINGVTIEPRDVFMAVMMNNARAIIAFHNHPSGDPSPSQGDIMLTQRLKEAGSIVGIELLDHMITGNEKYISLKEIGKF